MDNFLTSQKPDGVDTPEEKAQYEGKYCKIGSQDEPVKITKSFWATPCGYWTQCFEIERANGSKGTVMRGQVGEFMQI